MRRIVLQGFFPAASSCVLGTHRTSSSDNKLRSSTNSHTDYEADVIIVGGGVCGLSTALYLAHHGKHCIVLDREQVGASSQASSINSGILENISNLNSRMKPEALLASVSKDKKEHSSSADMTGESSSSALDELLCAGTMSIYEILEASGRTEFKRQGMLQVLETEDQWLYATQDLKLPVHRSAASVPTSFAPSTMKVACSESATLAPLEAPNTGMVVPSGEALQSLEPALGGSLWGAILFPDCAAAHPRKVWFQGYIHLSSLAYLFSKLVRKQ